MLRGKHITLRSFERKNIKKYREWVNDPEIASLIDRVLPVSEIEHEKWFENIKRDKNSVFFAIHQIRAPDTLAMYGYGISIGGTEEEK
jgi:hypothetical protein